MTNVSLLKRLLYSWADVDNDGDLDLFVPTWSENNFFYINNGDNNNNWINIKCVGAFSNRSAIGTKVRLKATISGKPVWQLREISGQTGLWAQNSLNAEFGLGDASVIDSIKIEWPTGRDQFETNIAIKQFKTITETVPLDIQNIPQPQINTNIDVIAEDNAGFISEVTLYYRRGGVGEFTPVPMSNSGSGSFQGTIPAAEVTSTGIEYRMKVVDNKERTARLPLNGSYSVPVHIPDGLSNEQARPHGNAQTAYRIFSVPLDLNNKSPDALLEDDLGEYDDTRWRLLEYLGDDNYLDFPDITDIVPGKGYWFITNDPARVIDSGSGKTTIISEEFAISLSPGWNLIGNPFNYSIPLENLRLENESIVQLRTFSGAWNNYITEKVEQMVPWEGYAIHNRYSLATTLFIDPAISSSHNSLARKTQENSMSWAINIHAQCQQARDVDNYAGVGLLSSPGWDQSDVPEPPPVGEYVSVYFPHPEWKQLSKQFCSDTRPELSKGEEWEFEIKTNIDDKVNLTFDGLETVPEEYEIWLVDKALNITQNLRQSENYSVAGSTENNPKRLSLVVGKQGFMQDKFSQLQLIPTDYELSQNYPNPFNPVTTIRYGLPSAGVTTLKVYNLLGKEVVTLVDNEQKEAGYHSVIWDGSNADGNVVVSGIYFIKMIAGDFVQIRKMVLVE